MEKYKCKNCEHTFDEPITVKMNTSEYWGTSAHEYGLVCPNCSNEAYFELQEWDIILDRIVQDNNDLCEVVEKYKDSEYNDFREYLEDEYQDEES